MDLLLTHGYFLFEDELEKKVMRPYPPLGLLYISSFLKAKGFNIEVFDTTFRTPAELYSTLDNNRPPVVGIYCNLMTKPAVLRIIQKCKAVGAITILGGPEPPPYAEEYLESGADIIVVGEGEHAMAELLRHLARHGLTQLEQLTGIIFRDGDGKCIRTQPRVLHPHLDDFPLPDREAIDLERYVETWREHHGLGSVSLICARGCPYTCTWCSHSVYGVSHRRRSPENVVAEVERLVDVYGPDMLWYADDVFTIHHRWLREYAGLLKSRGLRLPFECISREDRLNDQVIELLAEMGCRRLWIGSESGSQRILDAMQRRTDAQRVREMTRLLQKNGIEAGMFIMLGYDGETEDDLYATIEHLKKANPDIFLTTVSYPIKGTDYYAQIEDKVVADKPWHERTDRDLIVADRASSEYYHHANRWLVNEVALHQQRQNGSGLLRTGRSFLNARLARLGMRLSRLRAT